MIHEIKLVSAELTVSVYKVRLRGLEAGVVVVSQAEKVKRCTVRALVKILIKNKQTIHPFSINITFEQTLFFSGWGRGEC